MQTAKQFVHQILDSLPDDCTLDEISHRLYLQRKMDRSAADIADGRLHSADEAKEIIRNWFTSSGPTQL